LAASTVPLAPLNDFSAVDADATVVPATSSMTCA
jgi:hypothetical protein